MKLGYQFPTCATEFPCALAHQVMECPICDRQLCTVCAAGGKAFVCAACRVTFCREHRKSVGSAHFCPGCYLPALEEALKDARAELETRDRELAAYAAQCEKIAELDLNDVPEETRAQTKDIPGFEATWCFAVARSLAAMAPNEAAKAGSAG